MYVESSETATIGTVKTLAMQTRQYSSGLKLFHVYNHGPAPLTDAVFEWSNDGKVFGTATAPAFTLAADEEQWFNVPDGRPFWKFSCAVASGSTASITWKSIRN